MDTRPDHFTPSHLNPLMTMNTSTTATDPDTPMTDPTDPTPDTPLLSIEANPNPQAPNLNTTPQPNRIRHPTSPIQLDDLYLPIIWDETWEAPIIEAPYRPRPHNPSPSSSSSPTDTDNTDIDTDTKQCTYLPSPEQSDQDAYPTTTTTTTTTEETNLPPPPQPPSTPSPRKHHPTHTPLICEWKNCTTKHRYTSYEGLFNHIKLAHLDAVRCAVCHKVLLNVGMLRKHERVYGHSGMSGTGSN
ncbi:uncharacterized protein BO80DRAFT_484263 [Aspergillus ibericus CBS 121593]|uniref:C2H2-type domain-containing protein n=1 Tax=Aspergillus ibericus CBS 121593 TaxID=1448316 RepID=A0A395GLY3_9EURO|nr:hypothetical protein BO80DRAFT_484263 [Aspergillus ibericus CBS 121593]RAK96521.1 hypothetical protein BO80DRAFT_484263 [Aspergillus ibericus CBS 121593]